MNNKTIMLNININLNKFLKNMIKRIKFEIKNKIYKLMLIIFYRTNYFKFMKDFCFLKKNQFNTIERNLFIQRENLYNIINFSIKNVPYYRNLVEKNNIKIIKETIFEDIKQFPILTKEIIRKNWKDLHYDLKKFKYRLNTSGGTTGEPILVVQDQNYLRKGISGTFFTDSIGRFTLGQKLVLLWGSERDILENTQGVILPFINKYIKNVYFQNAFRMSDSILYKYVNQINRIKPKTILAYVQSIYEMAKYIKSKNLRIHSPNSIITSAGNLPMKLRSFIEDVFQCRIYNRYGSREVGNVAISCEKSNKLHINMFHYFIEILDNNYNPLDEHEKGEIIITSLINYGMPFIRYRIGDIGSLDYTKCSCGRGLIRLDNVYGRVVDIFKNEKRELIDGEYFTHLFYFRQNVKAFQVVQEEINQIYVNIVTLNKKPLDHSIESELSDKIREVMGENCKVNFNYVAEIEPSRSGKFEYTISKV